jgi:hypothetical protein
MYYKDKTVAKALRIKIKQKSKQKLTWPSSPS